MKFPGSTPNRLVVGLFFAADWCEACKAFTPVLMDIYLNPHYMF